MKQLARLALPLLLIVSVEAADSGSIGYVDIQVLLDKSKVGQQAQKTLEDKFAGTQKELAEEERAIRKLQQVLARDQAIMSQGELDKKKTEIQERIQALQKKAAQAQQEVTREQNKLTGAIIKPAQEIIGKVAKDKQISAVFERRQSGLLYIDKGLDLTPEVIERLDRQEKKQ